MKKIFRFIKALFTGLDTKDKRAIQDAIVITNNIKNFLESSYMSFFLAVIPGHIDDIIAAKLKKVIPEILIALKLIETADNLLTVGGNIQALHPSVKGDFLDAVAVQIALAFSDGRLTWSEVKSVMKVVYDSQKSK